MDATLFWIVKSEKHKTKLPKRQNKKYLRMKGKLKNEN